MLNSVPESMRACLIEAAKLAGPAFKRKIADPALAGAASGSGPISFNIAVDAGRGPAVPAAGVVTAFATAGGTGGSGGMPNAGKVWLKGLCARPLDTFVGCGRDSSWMAHAGAHVMLSLLLCQPCAESDPLIPGLMAGALGSDPLLGPLPPLSAPPSRIAALPLPAPVQAAGQAVGGSAPVPAAVNAGSGAQQLLNMGMIGWVVFLPGVHLGATVCIWQCCCCLWSLSASAASQL